MQVRRQPSLQQADSQPKVKNYDYIKQLRSEKDLPKMLDECGDTIVVLYLYTSWCNLCRTIRQPYYDIADKYHKYGKLELINCDLEECIELGYMGSIPAFIFFYDRNTIDRVYGADLKELELKICEYCELDDLNPNNKNNEHSMSESLSNLESIIINSIEIPIMIEIKPKQKLTTIINNKENLTQNILIIFIFYTKWSLQYRSIENKLYHFAKSYQNAQTVKFFKIDTDNCQKIAEAFDITAIPTLTIFCFFVFFFVKLKLYFFLYTLIAN